jgi:hemerythrin-like domain-containing protein
MMRERVDDIDREINRLQRIDFRLNKELVQKPYQYIDKIRDALDKE